MHQRRFLHKIELLIKIPFPGTFLKTATLETYKQRGRIWKARCYAPYQILSNISQEVPMRTKFFALSIVLILALTLSGCAVKLTQPATPPTLNVNGSAQITVSPDIAYISVGVQTQNASANEAVSGNTVQAQKIADALKAMGIEDKDIRTSNFSISPQQQFDDKGKLTGVIFVVDNTVYVTLHDLTKIGDVLTAVVGAGANNIYGIQFDVSDKTTALASARKTAVENARKQAEELAQAAGVKLGAVQNINYYNSYPTMSEGKGGGAMYDTASVSVPVAAGQLTYTVDVNIVYAIEAAK
jgi:uncharacterized protein YggE